MTCDGLAIFVIAAENEAASWAAADDVLFDDDEDVSAFLITALVGLSRWASLLPTPALSWDCRNGGGVGKAFGGRGLSHDDCPVAARGPNMRKTCQPKHVKIGFSIRS
jgi:hypothetical protein